MSDLFDSITALRAVRRVLRDARAENEWLTGFEVQQRVESGWGELYSESTITRRIREARDWFDVAKRKRTDSRAWEYQIAPRGHHD